MFNNDTLIIIPAFNEGKTILKIVNSLKNKYNYLVINDGSFDMSDKILSDNKVNYITNSENIGLSKTMRIGMSYAIEKNFKYCIQFDGDGQHDINTIDEMISFRQNFNLILASRFLDKKKYTKYHWKKEMVWKFLRIIFKIKCGKTISDPTCGLRLFDKNFMLIYINDKNLTIEPSFICYALKKQKMSIYEVGTNIKNRNHGESKFDKKSHQFYYLLREFSRMIFQ